MGDFEREMEKAISRISEASSDEEVSKAFYGSLYPLHEARLRDLGLSNLSEEEVQVACSMGAGEQFLPELFEELQKYEIEHGGRK